MLFAERLVGLPIWKLWVVFTTPFYVKLVQQNEKFFIQWNLVTVIRRKFLTYVEEKLVAGKLLGRKNISGYSV